MEIIEFIRLFVQFSWFVSLIFLTWWAVLGIAYNGFKIKYLLS